MARFSQDDGSSPDPSLSDYYGSFFGGGSDSGGGATISAPTVARSIDTRSGTSTVPTGTDNVPPGAVFNPDGTIDVPDGGYTPTSNGPDSSTASPGGLDLGQYGHGSGGTAKNLPPGGGASGSSQNAQQYLMGLLQSGMNPQQAIAQVNAQYGLGPGSSAAYYAPGAHGPGSGAVIGLAGYGGYYSQNADGSWGWTTSPEQAGASGSGLTGNGGTGFADPAYQQLADMVQQRLNQLGQPTSFPALDQYMSMLQQNEADAKARAQTFADQLSGRVAQLQQPLLTDANTAQIRANASNNLLAQRDNQLAAARADLARRGFDPNSSGLALNQQNVVNTNYSNAQSNVDAQLQEQAIQQDEQRKNQATQLQGLIQQALQGGDVTALQNQATMSDLENQLFNINQNQAREALTTAQIPVDLTNQGFANALNASNSTSNPLALMLSLAGLGNQQQGLQQAGSNSNMVALAWLLQQALA